MVQRRAARFVKRPAGKRFEHSPSTPMACVAREKSTNETNHAS